MTTLCWSRAFHAASASRGSLERMSKLLAETAQPWRAIHVAGGGIEKTSVCNLISANFDYYNRSRVLELTKHRPLSWGSFTKNSYTRWDGIAINYRPISKALFLELESRFTAAGQQIGASPAEIMTAIAFQAFTDAGVEVGIVETRVNDAYEEPTALLGTASGELARARPICLVLTASPETVPSVAPTESVWAVGAEVITNQALLIKPGISVVYPPDYGRNGLALLKSYTDALNATIVTPDRLKAKLEIPHLESTIQWYNPSEERGGTPENDRVIESALTAATLTLKELGRLERPAAINTERFEHHSAILLANFQFSANWATNVDEPKLLPLYRAPTLVSRPGRPNYTLLHLSPDVCKSSLVHTCAKVHDARRDGFGSHRKGEHLIWLLATENGFELPDMKQYIMPGDAVIATTYDKMDGDARIEAIEPQSLLKAITDGVDIAAHNLHAIAAVREALDHALTIANADEQNDNKMIVAAGSRWLALDILHMVKNDIVLDELHWYDEKNITERGIWEDHPDDIEHP